MRRTMLKSKIHRATVTGSDLNYVGSITMDADLLEAADIREHELVHVLDIDNGNRFETYTIAGARGSGEVQVNGAAARLVHTGDKVIVVSYAEYEEAELESYEPRVVHVDAANAIVDRGRGGRRSCCHERTHPSARRRPPRASRSRSRAGREEGPRRADRHGHRLRLPERPGGRGGRRGRGAGRRLRRHDRARLPDDRAGDASTRC